MDHLQKLKKEYKSLNKTGDSRYIYKNELDKACFQHDMAYGDFKDLKRRAAADNVLRDKAFNIAKNPKYKNPIKSIPQNEQLAEELHKPIIRKLKK